MSVLPPDVPLIDSPLPDWAAGLSDDALHSLHKFQGWGGLWTLAHKIAGLLFYYPLVMAYVWMIGAIIFYLRWEMGRGDGSNGVKLASTPPVTIMVPCYNEGPNVRETIEYAVRQDYPDFEVIAINDGSKDDTLAILHDLAVEFPRLRVINLASNQGKAMGLRAATLLSRGEIVIGIDGDSLLDKNATAWMVRHFLHNARVGAVTGNPRVRNRSTLLGRIQVGEFSAIVGMIKRAQRTYGRIFTVSGVITAFRKSALHDVGYWSPDMVTEDIDISWKLQLAGWTIRYEPNALCWVLMPETLKGLWKQRVRWAQGGAEVMLRYSREIMRWKSRRMWLLYFEYLTSVFWSVLILLSVFVLFDRIAGFHLGQGWQRLLPRWTSVLLSVTCLLQFGTSLAIDSRYERAAGTGGTARYYYWIVWYPLVYWMIGVGTALAGLYKAVTKKRGARAVWVTVDRGVRAS
jgi:poly-beta-1,6-N-acetyl-D-glucosamine synthase